jgi:hypothetical protein
MLALTTQFGCVSRLFAVFAAVFAVRAGLRDDAGAGRVRALIGIEHECPPDVVWTSLDYGPVTTASQSPFAQALPSRGCLRQAVN